MIGIFDSGIGGLGVTSILRKKAPKADIVYFGDLANMPYGPRPTPELFTLTIRALAFLSTQGATQYISACNSVSVSVIQPLIDQMTKPNTQIIEMVGPTVHAVKKNTHGPVIVAATQATVRSGMYERAFAGQGIEIEMIALPELARAIEDATDQKTLTHIIEPAVKKAIAINASTFVFGCTQYPFAKSIFEDFFDARQYPIDFFDPSEAVVDAAMRAFNTDGNGTSQFFVSKKSDVFDQTVRRLFAQDAEIKVIDVDNFVDKAVQEQWIKHPFQACASLPEC